MSPDLPLSEGRYDRLKDIELLRRQNAALRAVAEAAAEVMAEHRSGFWSYPTMEKLGRALAALRATEAK